MREIRPFVFAAGLLAVLIGSGRTVLGAPAEFRLTALQAPSGFDTLPSVPMSQLTFAVGSSIFLEVWFQTSNPNGLSSASLDLSFDASLAKGIAITPTAVFSELVHGTIDNIGGLVNDLSGSHLGPCTDAMAVMPNWARLAVVEFGANADGFLSIYGAATGSKVYGTAICGVGDINPATITFGSVNVTIGDGVIPAASTWGMVAMCLLLMITGTVVITRGHFGCAVP